MSTTEELKKRRLEAVDTAVGIKDEIENSKKAKVIDDQDRGEVVLDKKKQLSPFNLKINQRLEDPNVLKQLKSCWGKNAYEYAEKPNIKLDSIPFPYGEFHEILEDSSVLHKLQDTLEYEEKSSDLFHFHQSCDLNSLASEAEGFEPVQAIKDFFQKDLFNFVKSITNLPLNGKFDIFASQYEFNDHLLCHDDELDSRRIAFIIYMSEGWRTDYGGTLDLFDSIESEDNNPQPGSIVKSLCPEFNKLVFFEVTAKSFHQVSEVLKKEGDCRRAISGWFYGDPLPRPQVMLPLENFANVNFMDRCEIPLDEYLDDSYLNSENLKVVNEKLSENSEILLSNFFKRDVYPSITKELTSVDDSMWAATGPPNLQNYHSLENGIPQVLLTFFKSKTFLEFLQELTEFPFASEPELRFTLSMKKFQRGSYTLVRGKDRSYKIKNLATAAAGVDRLESEMSDSEGSLTESDTNKCVQQMENGVNNQAEDDAENSTSTGEIKTNGNRAAPEKSNPSINKNRSGDSDSGKESDISDEDLDEAGTGAAGSEDEDEEIIWEAEGGSDEEEETEEPNRVDVMFFIVPPVPLVSGRESSEETEGAPESTTTTGENGVNQIIVAESKWDEKWGGSRIYTDDLTGNALINLTPADNSLAVVVRDESISSHYSYVNCLAQNRVFYSYDFEFNFPRATN